MKNMKMMLCEGRHEIPEAVDGAIFPAVIPDPTDLEAMMAIVNGKLRYCAKLDLYVTGLTVALVTVVNYAPHVRLLRACAFAHHAALDQVAVPTIRLYRLCVVLAGLGVVVVQG